MTPVETDLRWALQIEGGRLDSQEAVHFYGGSSDPSIRYMDDGTGKQILILTSPKVDAFDTAQEAEAVAHRLLGLVNGLLFVLEPGRIPLAPAGIRARNSDGSWAYHIVVGTGSIIARGRARGVGVALVDGKPAPEFTRPAAAQRWMLAAHSDETVANVLTFLSGKPRWFDLYSAFEQMRDDINRRVGAGAPERMGWPQKKDLSHFQQSATVFRHSPAKWPTGYTPETAMTLALAARFVQGLADSWLQWRFP